MRLHSMFPELCCRAFSYDGSAVPLQQFGQGFGCCQGGLLDAIGAAECDVILRPHAPERFSDGVRQRPEFETGKRNGDGAGPADFFLQFAHLM